MIFASMIEGCSFDTATAICMQRFSNDPAAEKACESGITFGAQTDGSTLSESSRIAKVSENCFKNYSEARIEQRVCNEAGRLYIQDQR